MKNTHFIGFGLLILILSSACFFVVHHYQNIPTRANSQTKPSTNLDICTRTASSEKIPSADAIFVAIKGWGNDDMNCLFPSDIRINFQGERYWLVSYERSHQRIMNVVYDSQTQKLSDALSYDSFPIENENGDWVFINSELLNVYKPNTPEFKDFVKTEIGGYETFGMVGSKSQPFVIRSLSASSITLDVFSRQNKNGEVITPEEFSRENTSTQAVRQKTIDLTSYSPKTLRVW